MKLLANLLALELSGLLEPGLPIEWFGFTSLFPLSWEECPPRRPPLPAEDGRLLVVDELGAAGFEGVVPDGWLSEARLLFGILPTVCKTILWQKQTCHKQQNITKQKRPGRANEFQIPRLRWWSFFTTLFYSSQQFRQDAQTQTKKSSQNEITSSIDVKLLNNCPQAVLQ